MIETVFTPVASLAGGVLIGIASILLMLVAGRIMGATGIVAGLLQPASRDEFIWRVVLVLGMVTAPILIFVTSGEMPAVQVPVTNTMLVVGGLIVGIGVTFGGGCTSGHGVCGIARLSPRSIVATCVFMVATFATVFVIRHLIGG